MTLYLDHFEVAVLFALLSSIMLGLVTKRDGAEPGAAKLIHTIGRLLDWNPGIDGCLPRRILTGSGGQNLPQDHLGDLLRLNPGAFQDLGNGDLAQGMRR